MEEIFKSRAGARITPRNHHAQVSQTASGLPVQGLGIRRTAITRAEHQVPRVLLDSIGTVAHALPLQQPELHAKRVNTGTGVVVSRLQRRSILRIQRPRARRGAAHGTVRQVIAQCRIHPHVHQVNIGTVARVLLLQQRGLHAHRASGGMVQVV